MNRTGTIYPDYEPIILDPIIINSELSMPIDTQAWGFHLVLNLYECQFELIASRDNIERYIIELCDLIQMRRFGDPIIVHFGESEKVAGFSMFQLIETSNIAGHFANQSKSAYLDIFSCKNFDPQVAIEVTGRYFSPMKIAGRLLHRV